MIAERPEAPTCLISHYPLSEEPGHIYQRWGTLICLAIKDQKTNTTIFNCGIIFSTDIYPVLGVNPECNHSYTVDTSYCRPDECLQQHGLPRFEIESVHALDSVCHI